VTENTQRDNKPAKERQENPVARYWREVRGEVRKVTWPSRVESWRLTGIVLAATALVGVFLWIFDFLFSTGFRALVDIFVGA
jgi:preprotein translocase subunit SecE